MIVIMKSVTRLDHCAATLKQKNIIPLEKIIDATLRKVTRKVILIKPPPSPSSGSSRQGPVLRNFTMPKDAESAEDESARKNK